MVSISYVPKHEIQRVWDSEIELPNKLGLLGDLCRLNALAAVKRAGSGHLGSSFSAMDILVFLYFVEMNLRRESIDSPDRDIFFSSKGHDCPGQYSVLAAAGILPLERLFTLRRLGGLDGHPDRMIPGIEANSGSLGMGISKGKGLALGKKLGHRAGRVIVMTGDGELQEGQVWEALQSAAHHKVDQLHVIVDANRVQTDKLVSEIIDLGNLSEKFAAFGWDVRECDGHDFAQLQHAFDQTRHVHGKPKALICKTIKGRGVSFMEHPQALVADRGLYRWHSGAPDDESFHKAWEEITARINADLATCGLPSIVTSPLEPEAEPQARKKSVTSEKVVQAYGEALVELAASRKDIVVLDGDLSADCGLRSFESAYSHRFLENGIAEQDMVSTAGGLALQGFLPIVNSFSSFLSARANEQIYNNASEKTKIIYVCHYAGLIPAGPGKSHQSIRDISLFCALPNCVVLEPCNALETRLALQWCVEVAQENCMVRLAISASPRLLRLPADYRLRLGEGVALQDGDDAVLLAYGPVMLHEALVASELLQEHGISLKVVNLPWLNRVNPGWLEREMRSTPYLFVLDNHAPAGGLADRVREAVLSSEELRSRKFLQFAVEGYPACGTPWEVLGYHGLDGSSLAARINQVLGGAQATSQLLATASRSATGGQDVQ